MKLNWTLEHFIINTFDGEDDEDVDCLLSMLSFTIGMSPCWLFSTNGFKQSVDSEKRFLQNGHRIIWWPALKSSSSSSWRSRRWLKPIVFWILLWLTSKLLSHCWYLDSINFFNFNRYSFGTNRLISSKEIGFWFEQLNDGHRIWHWPSSILVRKYSRKHFVLRWENRIKQILSKSNRLLKLSYHLTKKTFTLFENMFVFDFDRI